MNSPKNASVKSFQQRIRSMFERYIPTKLHKIDDALEKYNGSESQFLKALVKKYGPEPSELFAQRQQDTGHQRQLQPTTLSKLLEQTSEAPPRASPHRHPKRLNDQIQRSQYNQHNQFLFQKDKFDQSEFHYRREVADEERRRFLKLDVTFRDARRNILMIEAKRRLDEAVQSEREKMVQEVQEYQRKKYMDALNQEILQRSHDLKLQEGALRMEFIEEERKGWRDIDFLAANSISKVYKMAVRRQREEAQRQHDLVHGSSEVIEPDEDQKFDEKTRNFKELQSKQRAIIENRMSDKAAKRKQEKVKAAQAQAEVDDMIRQLQKHKEEQKRNIRSKKPVSSVCAEVYLNAQPRTVKRESLPPLPKKSSSPSTM